MSALFDENVLIKLDLSFTIQFQQKRAFKARDKRMKMVKQIWEGGKLSSGD